MKILFVTNNINVPGNGICTSVNTTVQHLRDKGIDARFLSGISKDPKVPQPDFPLKRLHFPIFQPIIDANGFSYAKRDRRVIREAVEWADFFYQHIANYRRYLTRQGYEFQYFEYTGGHEWYNWEKAFCNFLKLISKE